MRVTGRSELKSIVGKFASAASEADRVITG
jgi:hypothetical protein